MRTLLVDNGSLRPDAVLNLRSVAARLSERVGEQIDPVSLLHSSKIDPALLGGRTGPNLGTLHQSPSCRRRAHLHLAALLLFGPTGAIQTYLPERLASLRTRFGDFSLMRAPFLFDEAVATDALAQIVAENVRRDPSGEGPHPRTRDSRSTTVRPLPSVTYVRNFVAGQLSLPPQRLPGEHRGSFHGTPGRRPVCLQRPTSRTPARSNPAYNRGDVIIAMLFLSPGRHAGPEGDVAQNLHRRPSPPLLFSAAT